MNISQIHDIKSCFGDQDWNGFKLIIDGFAKKNGPSKIDLFLTNVNYEIGALQYIRGQFTITTDDKVNGSITANTDNIEPIVYNNVQIADIDQWTNTVIKQCKTMIKRLNR